MAARYRNAWKCNKCPQSGDEDGCPAWAEYVERNHETGADRITRECVFQALPKFLIHAVAAANQAAATMDGHRNEMVAAMVDAAQQLRVNGGPLRLEHDA